MFLARREGIVRVGGRTFLRIAGEILVGLYLITYFKKFSHLRLISGVNS
jgi:hypothetical protein